MLDIAMAFAVFFILTGAYLRSINGSKNRDS